LFILDLIFTGGIVVTDFVDELMKAVAMLTMESSSVCCDDSVTTIISSLGLEGLH
jgi:hypothetical protein